MICSTIHIATPQCHHQGVHEHKGHKSNRTREHKNHDSNRTHEHKNHDSNRTREHKRSLLQQDSRTQKITTPTGLANTKGHDSNRTREHKRSQFQQDSRTTRWITIPTVLANTKDYESKRTCEHKGSPVQQVLRTQSITSPVGLVILCVLCQFVACSILITLTPTTTHIYKSNGFYDI